MGALVGYADGRDDGAAVGGELGVRVGERLGRTDGKSVGVDVGATVLGGPSHSGVSLARSSSFTTGWPCHIEQ